MTNARRLSGGAPLPDPQNWARSARKITTWNLSHNFQHNPRNTKWPTPDVLSGGATPPDTPKKPPQNCVRSTWKVTTSNPLQNVQRNRRNKGRQMLERVYSTDHVATGSFWGFSIPNKGLNPKNRNGSTRTQLLFPPTGFLFCHFFQPVWNCVIAISSQFAEKIEWRSKAVAYNIYSPQALHFPLWPGKTLLIIFLSFVM